MRARKINNRLEDATSTWDTTTTQKFTVPAGKRWFVWGGITNRSDAATLIVDAFDTSDEVIARLANVSSGTGSHTFPNSTAATTVTSMQQGPLCLDVGEYVRFTFGAAQGATAYLDLIVYEVDMY